MTIKTKLLFGILATVIVIAGAGLFIYKNTQQIDREIERTNIATKIVQVAATRRGLIFDYYRFHGERPKAQWQLLLDAQTKLTQSEVFQNDSEHQTLLAQISESSKQVNSLFAGLVASYEKPKSNPEEFALAKESEEVLVSRLMENIQANITRAYALSDNNLANMQAAQGVLVVATGASIAILLLFLVALFFFFNQFIARPLVILKEAAVRIASLDFSTTTTTTTTTVSRKDEIGMLSRAFNTMVVKLKESYQGLETKVKERTSQLDSVNQQLKASNQQLSVSNQQLDAGTQQLRAANQQLGVAEKNSREKVEELENTKKATLNLLEDMEVAKNQLEEAKAKDEAILSSIGDAVMACDKDGIVMLFNGVAQVLTGLSIKEVIGQHYRQILHLIKESDQKPGNDFIAEAIKTGQGTKMENHTLLVKKDGQKIPVADSAAPIKNAQGEIIGCVVVFRDASHERDVDKAKTEFVSLASHQLRTPLSSINWYAEMLLAGDAGKITVEQKKYLEEIYHGNQRMVDLVNALLNVSRMEMGTFIVEPEPTDVVLLARSVVSEQKPVVETKKLKLSEKYAKDLPLINADPKLLRIVFQNLLSNSVKYTPDKGKIGFDILVAKKGDEVGGKKVKEDSIAIVVSDSGYGIPAAQQEKIFTKLFRADNVREKDTDGTGLGLYIVKAIVDHSGGFIWFESVENKGTTFFVTLPMSGMKKKEGTRSLG